MTLAAVLQLKPSTRTILRHLETRGSISPMEARTAYGFEELRSRISELVAAGVPICRKLNRDGGGHRYARYFLVKT